MGRSKPFGMSAYGTSRHSPRRTILVANGAKRIIENGYNLTLTSLGLVESERTDHAEPEAILTSVAEKERRILEIVEEMRKFVWERVEA